MHIYITFPSRLQVLKVLDHMLFIFVNHRSKGFNIKKSSNADNFSKGREKNRRIRNSPFKFPLMWCINNKLLTKDLLNKSLLCIV